MVNQAVTLLRIVLLTFGLAFLLSKGCEARADQIDKAIQDAAATYKIRPKLLKAIVKVESNGNPKAVGKSHSEVGLMQLNPRYFPKANHNIRDNVNTGARYLAELKKKKKESYGCAWFVAYNVGPNLQLKHPKLHPYFKKVAKQFPEVCGGPNDKA